VVSRRTLLILLVGAVVVSALTTWVAAAQIRSPAEVAARTAAPEPSPVLVPVEKRVLATRIVTRGTAQFGSPRDVAVTLSELKGGTGVITDLPRRGSRVAAGDVIAEISGRPVFLLPGATPTYRDLGPGMSGPDVRQLERALRVLNLKPGAVDGTYDTATEAAVTRLYRRAGYQALVASESQLADARPPGADLVPGARAQGGVQLPSDEVVFVARTPVRVTVLPSPLGAPADEPLVSVTGTDIVVRGAVPVEQAAQVKAGAEVVVDEPTLGIDTTGQVEAVAGRPGTQGADGFHVAFEVFVAEPTPALIGASVRLTIPIESTEEAQLVVPVSAVSLGPDGSSRVEKAVGGERELVPVSTGLSADGYIVVAAENGKLAVGDEVVIGFRSQARR
jgi:peptidoglycan hydrolase-like protein with peptidoglycan-binding domain